MKSTIQKVLREQTLSTHERVIVSYIMLRKGVSCSQVALAAELNLRTATVTRAVKRLVKMGVLQRTKPEGLPIVYQATDDKSWRLHAKVS